MTTSRIPTLEKIIDQQAERTDGCDLYAVLSMIADASGDFLPDCIDSMLYRDIIRYTQSRPEQARNAVIRMARADNAISRYDT